MKLALYNLTDVVNLVELVEIALRLKHERLAFPGEMSFGERCVGLKYAQLNYFFLISEMIVPGSTYWNVAFGHEKGEVENDTEGMETVRNLAQNMAWLMKKLE